jgi:hypothetical protein
MDPSNFGSFTTTSLLPVFLLPPHLALITYSHDIMLSCPPSFHCMSLHYLLLPCTTSTELVFSSHCMRGFTSVSLTRVALDCCMQLLNTDSQVPSCQHWPAHSWGSRSQFEWWSWQV